MKLLPVMRVDELLSSVCDDAGRWHHMAITYDALLVRRAQVGLPDAGVGWGRRDHDLLSCQLKVSRRVGGMGRGRSRRAVETGVELLADAPSDTECCTRPWSM